MSLIVFSLPH